MLYYKASEIRIAGDVDNTIGGWILGIRLCNKYIDSNNNQDFPVSLTIWVYYRPRVRES
jgi:hypothetical protein